MKYVKLIAKADTWFKEGTEVYDYECDPPNDIRRMTLDEWNGYDNCNCLVRGIRIPKLKNEIDIFGTDERWDGELCDGRDFEMEIVDEPH